MPSGNTTQYQQGDLNTIDNATLLQVDITAIVGVLIFLTLQRSGGKIERSGEINPMEFNPTGITYALVLPFAISGIFILVSDLLPTPTFKDLNADFAKWMSIFGFAYIAAVLFLTYFRQATQRNKT